MSKNILSSGRLTYFIVYFFLFSGNTGIGLAVCAAVKGYRCIIVMPEKMSAEKANILRALGAEIIRTPTAAKWDAPDSHISVAQRLCKSLPRSIILDQYVNAGNPVAHYDTTAEEILYQTGGKVDMVVICAGTGGTISGIGRKLKEKLPYCKIVGVDPMGSILAQPDELNSTNISFYEVEGIGYDFIPTVLDRSVVDEWIKSNDKDSLIMARELIAKEGLLCGGSSGAAMWAATKAAKELREDQTCVVLLPDSVRNYMTKFIDDTWMAERGFLTASMTKAQDEKPSYWDLDIFEAIKEIGSNLLTVTEDSPISKAIEVMRNAGIDQIPVVGDNNELKGMVTVIDTMKKLVGGSAKRGDPVTQAMITVFPTISKNQPLGELVALLKMQAYVVIVDQTPTSRKVIGIVTHVDVLNYLVEKQSQL